MDPVTIGLIASAVIGGASSVAATPNMSQMNSAPFAGANFIDFDNSGFAVNVGSGSASAAVSKTNPASSSLAAAAGLMGGGASPLSVLGLLGSPLGLIVIGGAAWYFLKK